VGNYHHPSILKVDERRERNTGTIGRCRDTEKERKMEKCGKMR
jgi:hypothetical protein